MTDNEIIKALECCIEFTTKQDGFHYCEDCHFNDDIHCDETLSKNALDLINRQRAEIERLKKAVEVQEIMLSNQDYMIKKARSEAIKECIEKVKEEIAEALKSNYKARAEKENKEINSYLDNLFWNYCNGKVDCLRGLDDFCDNLAKEMVGDSNDK